MMLGGIARRAKGSKHEAAGADDDSLLVLLPSDEHLQGVDQSLNRQR